MLSLAFLNANNRVLAIVASIESKYTGRLPYFSAKGCHIRQPQPKARNFTLLFFAPSRAEGFQTMYPVPELRSFNVNPVSFSIGSSTE